MDGSYDNWNLLLNFVETVVDAFDVGRDKIRIGAVKFSNDARLIMNLEESFDSNEIKRKVLQTNYMGGFTNTYDGLRVLRENCFGTANGDRPDVRMLLLC